MRTTAQHSFAPARCVPVQQRESLCFNQRVLVAFAWLLLAAAPGPSQPVYSWTDADGVEHFTDDPNTIPKAARVKRVPTAEEPPKPKLLPAPEKQVPPTRVDDSSSKTSKTAGAAAVDSSMDAQSAQQEIPEELRQFWRLAIPHLRSPPSGPAFVELAETTTDPRVLSIALHAVGLLYTAQTSIASNTSNGKPYPVLPANDRVFRVGLQHLDHPDAFVRFGAAKVVGLGIARAPPNDQLIKAIAERFSLEADLGVRGQLLQVLWSCHCANRAMADSAIWFAEQKDQPSRLHGLRVMRKVGKKGRNFDAETKGHMRRAAEASLSHPSAEVRLAAEAAARACAWAK